MSDVDLWCRCLRSGQYSYHVEPRLADRPSWRWGRVSGTGLALLLLLPLPHWHTSYARRWYILLLRTLQKLCWSLHGQVSHVPDLLWEPRSSGAPWLSYRYSFRNPFLTSSSNWNPNAKQLCRLWPRAWWNSHQVSLLGPSLLSIFGGDFSFSATLGMTIRSLRSIRKLCLVGHFLLYVP